MVYGVPGNELPGYDHSVPSGRVEQPFGRDWRAEKRPAIERDCRTLKHQTINRKITSAKAELAFERPFVRYLAPRCSSGRARD
jgi:hypothetical protein